jgi:hypothetical protein
MYFVRNVKYLTKKVMVKSRFGENNKNFPNSGRALPKLREAA